MTTVDLIESAHAVLDQAYDTYEPSHVFALLSGGHDSMTATSLAMEWAKRRKLWVPVVHANTGTGIAPRHVEGTDIVDTHTHVLRLCEAQGWPLIELHPPVSYETLVRQMGFPGPGYHDRLAYPRLKDRAFRNLDRMAPEGKRVMLVTGIRREESYDREIQVVPVQEEGARRVWAAPIFDWTKADCNALIAERGMPRNQVSDLIHLSGECLCGAMAHKGELNEIAEWFPLKAQEIRDLEDEVERLGLRADRWGRRPPAVGRDQQKLFLVPNAGPPMACAGCATRRDEADGEAA